MSATPRSGRTITEGHGMMDMMNARYVLLVGRAPPLVLEGHLEAAAGAYERPLPRGQTRRSSRHGTDGRARFHHPINESSRAAHPISRLAGPLWASRMPSCQSKPDEQFRTCPDSRSVHNDRRRCGRRAPPDRRFDDVARWCFYQARQREEG